MKLYKVPTTNRPGYEIGDPIVPFYVPVHEDPNIDFEVVDDAPEPEDPA